MILDGRPQPPPPPRVRPAAARGRLERGGICTLEAFSRGEVVDPAWMGWGALRVLSHQHWAPGAVRDEGRMANMERLLLVLRGRLDADFGNLGTHRVATGGVLHVSAGHGLSVRLANASPDQPLCVVELWLQPARVNSAPSLVVLPAVGVAAAGAFDGTREPGWRLIAEWGLPGGTQPGQRPSVALQVGQVAAGHGQSLPPTAAGGRFWLEVLEGEVRLDGPHRRTQAGNGPTGEGYGSLGEADGLGWRAADPAAPEGLVAGTGAPACVLLLSLPS